jgi:hypothetical protein
MNLNHLSDVELLRYLDLTSTDPLVKRLINMLSAPNGGLVGDLVEAGMDPNTWVFTDDHQDYYPGDYITHLQKMVAYAEDDRAVAEMDLADAREELDKLSRRTVTELLVDAQRAIDSAKSNHLYAVREAEKAHEVIDKVQAENRHLKEQLGMWNILGTE